MYIHKYKYIHIHMYMYVCMYINTYLYICIYIYIFCATAGQQRFVRKFMFEIHLNNSFPAKEPQSSG